MSAALLASLLLASGAPAASWPPPAARDLDAAVAEAARNFGLPQAWIWAVIGVESGGDPRAVSPKGALGLMQLMPGTWGQLRARLALGADPFDVHDNVVAGSAYLREMLDRFGAPGFLAAYNTGPARYRRRRAGGAPLPLETRRYLARMAPRLAGLPAPQAPPRAPSLFPQGAALFPATLGSAT